MALLNNNLNNDFYLFDRFNIPRNFVEPGGLTNSALEPSGIYDYQINSDGLRSIEFYEKPEVLTLGCSMTYGMGLPEEDRWSNILEKMIEKDGKGYKVGNIGYNGGSIMKSISAFFGIVNKYNFYPKYVFANFPFIDRFWFINSIQDGMQDMSTNFHTLPKTSAKFPFDWSSIIAPEWVYYINFEYIKMLEIFCQSNNIKLVWSTWTHDTFDLKSNEFNNFDDYCYNKFKFYKKDPTAHLWKCYHYGPDIAESYLDFDMKNWENEKCHQDLFDKYGHRRFNVAYDEGDLYEWIKKSGARGGNPPRRYVPHFGVHRQTHWAEFYYSFMV